MENGEFHWRGGVFVKRDDLGRVHLRIEARSQEVAESHQSPETDARTPNAQSGWITSPELPSDVVLVIPSNEWQSIIAHVSAKGSTSEGYAAAEALHA